MPGEARVCLQHDVYQAFCFSLMQDWMYDYVLENNGVTSNGGFAFLVFQLLIPLRPCTSTCMCRSAHQPVPFMPQLWWPLCCALLRCICWCCMLHQDDAARCWCGVSWCAGIYPYDVPPVEQYPQAWYGSWPTVTTCAANKATQQHVSISP